MIFQNFSDDKELLKYIPNNPNLQNIPRELLLSILVNVKREKCVKLYSKYKEIKMQRSTTNNKIYKAYITNQFLNGLHNFASVNM